MHRRYVPSQATIQSAATASRRAGRRASAQVDMGNVTAQRRLTIAIAMQQARRFPPAASVLLRAAATSLLARAPAALPRAGALRPPAIKLCRGLSPALSPAIVPLTLVSSMRTALSHSCCRLATTHASVVMLILLTALLAACGEPTGVNRRALKLVFVRAPSYDTLFVVSPGSGTIEQRVALPVRAGRIRISPAGDRIATVAGGAVWVMNSDASDARQIVSNVVNIAWSPDGKRIAYVRGSPHELHLVDADGDNDTIIPGAIPGGFEGLAWSPDGGRIAFEGMRRLAPGATRTVYIVNLDGTGIRDIDLALAGPGARASGEPTWSPDGRYIAFHRYFLSGDGTAETKLWVMNVATGRAQRITTGDGDDVRAAWSPGGDQITFLRFDGSMNDVFVVRPDGTGLQRLTDTPDREEEPHYWIRR